MAANLPNVIEGTIHGRYLGNSTPLLHGEIAEVRDSDTQTDAWVEASFKGGPWFVYLRYNFELAT